MALPSKQELKDAIVHILTRARDEGRLDQLTVRIVLRELATRYDLEEDVLNSKTYKPFIKDTVFATMSSFEVALDGDAEPSERIGGKEEEEDSTAKASKRKRRPAHSLEEGDAPGSEAPPSKKASARSRSSKKVRPGELSKKPESEGKFKSKAIIESSDEEVVTESGTRKPTRSPEKERMSKKLSPPKQKQKKANKDNLDGEMDTAEGAGPSSSSSRTKPATESAKSSVSKAEGSSKDLMDAELSSVIDEPSAKRKKKQEKGSTKSQKEIKVKRGKKEALSKDEETVNKLKGIVLACGVRKIWKKEFEGLDRPSRQIKRLHSILGDLGMTPRYSLEKAKVIKEQRELAQELKDVQEFDKAIKRRERGLYSSPETGGSMAQDVNDADLPARKKQSARASIMAFLQDQSEEE